jgi:hypothetical protein
MMASMAMVHEENQLPLITPLLAALDKSCRRSAQEQPSSLSPRSRKRRYQDTGPYDARFSSRFPLSSVLHERRARANGEELEKYQSWYWAASGMAHEKADFQKTVKRWRANQPLCQHQGDPNVRGKSGSRLPSSRSQQIRALSRGPDPSLLQREWDISQRNQAALVGHSWVYSTMLSRVFSGRDEHLFGVQYRPPVGASSVTLQASPLGG